MAKKIIKELEARGVTKKQISKRLGVHYNTVLRWYHIGKASAYNMARLKALLNDKPKLNKTKDFDLFKELTDRGYKVTLT